MTKEKQIEEMARDLVSLKPEYCEAWNCKGCNMNILRAQKPSLPRRFMPPATVWRTRLGKRRRERWQKQLNLNFITNLTSLFPLL